MKKVLRWGLTKHYSVLDLFFIGLMSRALIDGNWVALLVLFVLAVLVEKMFIKLLGDPNRQEGMTPVDQHPGDDLLDESGQGFFLVWDGDEFDWPHVRQYSRSRKEGRSKGWNCSGVTHWMPIPKVGDA